MIWNWEQEAPATSDPETVITKKQKTITLADHDIEKACRFGCLALYTPERLVGMQLEVVATSHGLVNGFTSTVIGEKACQMSASTR